jgi:hypothetical protein
MPFKCGQDASVYFDKIELCAGDRPAIDWVAAQRFEVAILIAGDGHQESRRGYLDLGGARFEGRNGPLVGG